MTVKRVIFVRPGETEWNQTDRWQGWVAIPLNSYGRLQAVALANFLRNIGIGQLYSSDLKRAAETAEIIGEKIGCAPTYDSRLRERHIGQWQGLTRQEAQLWYPEEYAQLQVNRDHYQVPGGESFQEVKIRMQAAFEEILTKAEKAENIAIVSHTIAIRGLLSQLIQGYDPASVRLGNTSVTTIKRDGAGWQLTAANDIMHLEGITPRYAREAGEEDDPRH